MKARHHIVDDAHHAAVRQHLQTKGATDPELDAATGVTPNKQTREQLALRLAAWLKDRPKAIPN